MSQTTSSQARWLHDRIDAFETGLLRYASRICGDRAQDVVQESFIRLWEADPRPEPDVVRRWLYRVCRNRAIDVARKEARLKPLSLLPEPGAPGIGPQRIELQESGRTVVRALETLTEHQQEIVRLRFQEGLSYREIADVIGSSTNSVGVSLHKALARIRKEVVR